MHFRSRMAILLALAAVVGLDRIHADEKPAGAGPRFQVIDGKTNGATEALTKRYAEMLERKGGVKGSHDWWLWGLTAIDYDRDGDADFIVANHGPPHGIILKNLFKETGKLTFIDATKELGVDWQLPSGEGRKPIACDLNGDGWLDIIGHHSPHFLNEQGKKFQAVGKANFATLAPQAVVDLNGDGFLDLHNNGGFDYTFNPKTSNFDQRKEPVDPLGDRLPADLRQFIEDGRKKPANRFLRIHTFRGIDLNGDGLDDAIVRGYASYGGDAFGRYLFAGKDGRLTDETRARGLPENGAPILFRDLTGDGHPDLLIAAHADGGLFVNDGAGRFKVQPGPLTDHLRSRDPYLQRADAADFDHDGDLDLVVVKPRSGPAIIFENKGGGDFKVLHSQRGWDSDPVAVCDLNGDGLLDVAIGGPGDAVTLYLNQTETPGHSTRIFPRMEKPNVNAVGGVVRAFAAGTLGQAGKRPILTEDVHADGTAVPIGLGAATAFDLQVTFPGGKTVEHRNVPAGKALVVTPDGKLEEVK